MKNENKRLFSFSHLTSLHPDLFQMSGQPVHSTSAWDFSPWPLSNLHHHESHTVSLPSHHGMRSPVHPRRPHLPSLVTSPIPFAPVAFCIDQRTGTGAAYE